MKSHVLPTCRMALLSQGVTGLHQAPCLRALLLNLPSILQDQYLYEKPLVVSGEQLVHSNYLKCLTALALSLKLDRILCYVPAPPNTDAKLNRGKVFQVFSFIMY